MAGKCGCTGTETYSGADFTPNSIAYEKLKQYLSYDLPGIDTWPVNGRQLVKYVNDQLNNPNTGGTGSNSVILFDQFGGPGKTGAENHQALLNAIAEAQNKGIGTIQYGVGTYVQDGLDLIALENITIQGYGYDTKIQMSSAVADDVFKLRECHNVTIRRMRIDVENSADAGFSGGIWINGTNNLVEDVTVLNGDARSIIVSGVYSNGSGFVAANTDGNIVRRCAISGQRRYHSVGGKAALLAGDGAKNTLFEDILLVDNFLALETGDYADNDGGLSTTFRNITCIKTTDGLAPGAGLHLEGGEDYADPMIVTVENLVVRNFTVCASVSEKTQATFIGKNFGYDCKYGIKSYGIYTPEFDHFEFIRCGVGLESTDTEGVVCNITSGVYKNLTFTGTLARCAFVNYNGNPANSVTIPTRLEGCKFDKYVRLSYSNVGSYFISLAGCQLSGTRLDWYDNVGLRVDITDCQFYNSTITGARAKQVNISGNCRFYTSNSALTAINLSLDNFNVLVTDTTFEGYAAIGSNVTLGFGTRWTNITSPPTSFGQDPAGYVQGDVATATRFITTLNDTALKTGTYSVSGSPGTTGAPTDPFGYDYWYVDIKRLTNSGGTLGAWLKMTITNLDGSAVYERYRQDIGPGAWTSWKRMNTVVTVADRDALTALATPTSTQLIAVTSDSTNEGNEMAYLLFPTGNRFRFNLTLDNGLDS